MGTHAVTGQAMERVVQGPDAQCDCYRPCFPGTDQVQINAFNVPVGSCRLQGEAVVFPGTGLHQGFEILPGQIRRRKVEQIRHLW